MNNILKKTNKIDLNFFEELGIEVEIESNNIELPKNIRLREMALDQYVDFYYKNSDDKEILEKIDLKYKELFDIEMLKNEAIEIVKKYYEKKQQEFVEDNIVKPYKTRTTFEDYRKYQEEKYIKISKEKEYKQFLFTQKIIMQNTKSKDEFTLNHDILKKSKDTYLYFFYTQKLMEEKYINNEDYVAIFLTLTCPSKFHRYSATTNNYNPNYDENTTLNEAYKVLNDSFREIYKNFKVKRKFVKVEYSKVLEPHKNLTPHLHSLIYIKKEYVSLMENHIKNVIKKNEVGEHKILVIKDTSRSASYLLKYVQKTTNPNNERDFHFFNGWKKANKIRVFTTSSSILERAIYRKINTITKLSKDLEDKNAIQNVLDNCQIKIKQNEYDIDEDFDYIKQGSKTKVKGNKNGRYKVKVVKEKINKKEFLGKEFFRVLNIENGFEKQKIIEGNFEHFKKYISFFQDYFNVRFSKKNIKNINEKFEVYKENLIFQAFEEKTINFNDIFLKGEYLINVEEINSTKTSLFELIFKDLTISKSLYKIVDFKIYDKELKQVIYNKKDFSYEKNFEITCPKFWKDSYTRDMYFEDLYKESFFTMDKFYI